MIDYSKVIENDFEEEIYKCKFNEVISYLNQFKCADFWTIIKRVGGSERRMLRLLNQMVEENDIFFDNDKHMFYIKNIKYIQKFCPTCNGDRVIINQCDDKRELLKKIWKQKPLPTFLFDQRPVNMKTSLKRASYFLNRGDLIDKNIVLLGDDDLTSIAIAIQNVNCNITVLDADKRLINYINEVAFDNGFANLKAYEFNVNDRVPDELKNKFDTLFTDPTPERTPFTIFMNCAIDLLRNSRSIIYTSIYSSAMAKTIDLQRVINEMNLLITDVIPEFSEYKAIYELYTESDLEIMKKFCIDYNENSICFTESMFRLEVIPETKRLNITYNGRDLFGKATKRAIKDINNDLEKENDYLIKLSQKLIEDADKKFES